MTVPAIDPKLAAALADRYRLERALGEGGSATVYVAQDLRHQRPVAVKVLREELAAAGRNERAVAIAAFARELSERAGVVIDHPMDPGVAERIEALKATIPETELEGLEADARALTPEGVLEMISARG